MTDDRPVAGDPLELIDRLDDDNERLRHKTLRLMELLEDAVTAQVRAERRVDELEHELEALRATRLMRWSAGARSAYGSLRRRLASRGR